MASTVYFKVRCNCGEELVVNDVEFTRNGDIVVTTSECAPCMNKARDGGNEDGYTRGHNDGYIEGLDAGREQGGGS